MNIFVIIWSLLMLPVHLALMIIDLIFGIVSAIAMGIILLFSSIFGDD